MKFRKTVYIGKNSVRTSQATLNAGIYTILNYPERFKEFTESLRHQKIRYVMDITTLQNQKIPANLKKAVEAHFEKYGCTGRFYRQTRWGKWPMERSGQRTCILRAMGTGIWIGLLIAGIYAKFEATTVKRLITERQHIQNRYLPIQKQLHHSRKSQIPVQNRRMLDRLDHFRQLPFPIYAFRITASTSELTGNFPKTADPPAIAALLSGKIDTYSGPDPQTGASTLRIRHDL